VEEVLSRGKTKLWPKINEFLQTSKCLQSKKESGRCTNGRMLAEGGKYGKRAVEKRENSKRGSVPSHVVAGIHDRGGREA